MKRWFKHLAAGLIAALGRPAAGVALSPDSHVQRLAAATGQAQDWWRYDVVTGDTVEEEARKLAEADTGKRVIKPVWVNLTPEQHAEAQRSFMAWAAESDARVIAELQGAAPAGRDARLAAIYKRYTPSGNLSWIKYLLTERQTVCGLLLEAIPCLNKHFGDDIVIELRAPLDSFASKELSVSVQWPGSVGDVRAALSNFDDEWLSHQREASGNICFTYELVGDHELVGDDDDDQELMGIEEWGNYEDC